MPTFYFRMCLVWIIYVYTPLGRERNKKYTRDISTIKLQNEVNYYLMFRSQDGRQDSFLLGGYGDKLQ